MSAVMTSTEADSGHTIQKWGHRRWSHGDRPDPDATVTAEAIEQRPGVPSADAPTHPNREPTRPTRDNPIDEPGPAKVILRSTPRMIIERKTCVV